MNETLERVFTVLQWICFSGSIEVTQTVVRSQFSVALYEAENFKILQEKFAQQ